MERFKEKKENTLSNKKKDSKKNKHQEPRKKSKENKISATLSTKKKSMILDISFFLLWIPTSGNGSSTFISQEEKNWSENSKQDLYSRIEFGKRGKCSEEHWALSEIGLTDTMHLIFNWSNFIIYRIQ